MTSARERKRRDAQRMNTKGGDFLLDASTGTVKRLAKRKGKPKERPWYRQVMAGYSLLWAKEPEEDQRVEVLYRLGSVNDHVYWDSGKFINEAGTEMQGVVGWRERV